MVAGIKAFGTYVPRYRLGRETAGWGMPVEKAISNFDEDSITMAAAAGLECLRGVDRQKVDAIYFATTTPPYLDQQSAALVAEALDLRRDIFAADVTGVIRAGTIALRSAIDAVNAGSARQALVVAADCRLAAPRGDLERNLGDGAAAVLVSKGRLPVHVLGGHVITEHMLDAWRTPGEAFVRTWEDRFITEEGYERLVPQAMQGLLSKVKLGPQDISRVSLVAPDGRKHQDMVRRLGFKPEQAQDPLFGKVGNTGAAYGLTMLVGALETAKAGDRILLVDYGDGADAIAIQVDEGIERARGKGHRSLAQYVDAKRILANYELYARWRNIWTSEGARRPPPAGPSVSALWRERDQNLRLYGSRCNSCGCIQYPPQLVCTKCQASDGFTQVRLAEKGGTLFTYSLDYIAGTVDVPLVIAVINFNGGGRMLSMMTDRELDELQVNMPVEMTFRKLRTVGGINNYYWKSMPVRIPQGSAA